MQERAAEKGGNRRGRTQPATLIVSKVCRVRFSELTMEKHVDTLGARVKGSLTLGGLEGTIRLLEIRCTRCNRYGRERVTRLIERYGREARLPDLRHRLASDCPHHNATICERGDVYFPQLVELRR